jgi:hypothetical protein
LPDGGVLGAPLLPAAGLSGAMMPAGGVVVPDADPLPSA